MQLIECPRDAMQGLHDFIPTQLKTQYINALLGVGFHTIDFGSFVSPKAIPQLRDTAEVLDGLDLSDTDTKLLVIIANQRGAEQAFAHEQISYLGYPLSLSETFQQRNTNRSIALALDDLARIQEGCARYGKTLVTYLSMGFGNPYGDPYNADYLTEFVDKLDVLGIHIISLADTVGLAKEIEIKNAFDALIPGYRHITFGAHLHATPDSTMSKINAAYQAGCRRFDSAIYGIGGCPMANDDLVGNMATELLVQYLGLKNLNTELDHDKLTDVMKLAKQVFTL